MLDNLDGFSFFHDISVMVLGSKHGLTLGQSMNLEWDLKICSSGFSVENYKLKFLASE